MACPYSQQKIIIPEGAPKLTAPLSVHFNADISQKLMQCAHYAVKAEEIERKGCRGEDVRCVNVNWQDPKIQDLYQSLGALDIHLRILSDGHGDSAVARCQTLTLYLIKAVDGRFRFADAYTFG